MTRVAVVGIGAIGGWVAARLAQAGVEPSCLARGATLAALRRDGLALRTAGTDSTVAVRADDRAEAFGRQDVVVVAVKTTQLAAASAAVLPLIGPSTAIVPMINGVPWWFLADRGEPPLASIDPTGAIAAALPADQVVGCVVHASCRVSAPARITSIAEDRLVLGAATAAAEPLVEPTRALFAAAGLPAVVSATIRQDVWYKLWGNMTMNPISALTRSTTDRILDDPLVTRWTLDAMAEAAMIGARIGCTITESGEARLAVTRRLGGFRTSMLQDIEAGRELEVAAILEAPREIAQRLAIPTPTIDALLGLTRLASAAARRPG